MALFIKEIKEVWRIKPIPNRAEKTALPAGVPTTEMVGENSLKESIKIDQPSMRVQPFKGATQDPIWGPVEDPERGAGEEVDAPLKKDSPSLEAPMGPDVVKNDLFKLDPETQKEVLFLFTKLLETVILKKVNIFSSVIKAPTPQRTKFRLLKGVIAGLLAAEIFYKAQSAARYFFYFTAICCKHANLLYYFGQLCARSYFWIRWIFD